MRTAIVRAGSNDAMTPSEFITKWRASELTVLHGDVAGSDGAHALWHGVRFKRWCLVHCRRLGVYPRRRW